MPAYPGPDSRNVLEDGCTRCPALADCRNRISWGNGSTAADIMVVGEAPGAGSPEAEAWRGGNWTGMAYTSRHSGRRIRDLFEELGYAWDDLYVTNAVKCFPEGEDGSNREPTDEELERCFTHLESEIEQVDPAVVVSTGKHATRIVLDREGIERDGFVDSVLEPVACPTLGTTLLPLLHPSYQNIWRARLGYDREEYVAAIRDRLASCMVTGDDPPSPSADHEGR